MASNQKAEPEIGSVQRDRRTGTVGVVMGAVGGKVQLRPPKGGREWDVAPENVEAVSSREELSARVAVANTQYRRR